MECLFHLIVPSLIALAVGCDRKKVVALAPLAILPDFDHALVYRALLHSVFFLVLAVAAVYAIKKDGKSAILAAFFIGSHLLFDMGGGIGMFYPIDDHYYSLQAYLVGKAGWCRRGSNSHSPARKAKRGGRPSTRSCQQRSGSGPAQRCC